MVFKDNVTGSADDDRRSSVMEYDDINTGSIDDNSYEDSTQEPMTSSTSKYKNSIQKFISYIFKQLKGTYHRNAHAQLWSAISCVSGK